MMFESKYFKDLDEYIGRLERENFSLKYDIAKEFNERVPYVYGFKPEEMQSLRAVLGTHGIKPLPGDSSWLDELDARLKVGFDS